MVSNTPNGLHRDQITRDDITEIESSGGDVSDRNVQRGTKDLMAAIQAGINNQDNQEDIEDVDIEESTEE